MEKKDFDTALRAFVSDSKLPYEPVHWEHMAARLSVHEAQEQEPRRRLLPLFTRLAAAAAVVGVVLMSWFIVWHNSANTNYAGGIVSKKDVPAAAHTNKPIITTPSGKEVQPSVSLPSGNNEHYAKDLSQATRQEQNQHTPAIAATMPTQQPQASQPEPSASSATEERIAARTTPEFGLPMPDEEPRRTAERKTDFGINGGYNIGTAKNNFTVGVSVKRKLSSRVHVEAGIAMVSGSYTSRGVSPGSDYQPGPGTHSFPQTEDISRNLLYLQAAPSISYQVYRGLSAGAGVDAQRLLTASSKAAILNIQGETTPLQPAWDFGLTGRIDVKLSQKLRGGLMYRESVKAFSNTPSSAVGRNYLLVQLRYSIF